MDHVATSYVSERLSWGDDDDDDDGDDDGDGGGVLFITWYFLKGLDGGGGKEGEQEGIVTTNTMNEYNDEKNRRRISICKPYVSRFWNVLSESLLGWVSVRDTMSYFQNATSRSQH